MADVTDTKNDEVESITTKQISKEDCLTGETEQETTELTNVAQIPSRDWQIGCNLNECLLNVYKNDRWTDMTIRCGDKEVSRTLKAHKIILAARSPFFEAMLFGPCSDGKTEYEFPEADVDIFDMMLRFMYNDDINVTGVNEATDLMQMAHMYQIASLVDHCAKYLQTNITMFNVCKILECALKYSSQTLDACSDFVDRNVQEFMQTDGFLNLSNEGLIYLLEGDTFFAEEDFIFHRVEEWAKLKLSAIGKETNGQNIREALGDAFYHIRLTTLPGVKLMECIKRKGYFSFDEHEDIMDCCLKGQSHPSFVSHVRRVPLEESLSISSDTESLKNTSIDQVLQIKIDKDLHLVYVEIPLIRTFMQYSGLLYSGQHKLSKRVEGETLPIGHNPVLSVVVTIEEINFDNRSKVHQLSNESSKIVFDKPLLLKKRDTPFDLRIIIEPICKDSKVWLTGTYQKAQTSSSSSNVVSVSQKWKSMIGINAIGIRNFSFRGKIEHIESYIETGHGKGSCDGLGASVIRMADMAVKQQKCSIQDAYDFFEWAADVNRANETKVKFIKYTEEDIEEAATILKAKQQVVGNDEITCSCSDRYENNSN